MAKFIVKVDSLDYHITKFIEETNKRLSNADLVKNPFYGSLKLINHKEENYLLVDMIPIYPVSPFVYLSALSAVIILVMGGPYYLYFFPMFLFAITLLWTDTFMYLFLFLGLRKNRYKGKINIVRNTYIKNAIFENII